MTYQKFGVSLENKNLNSYEMKLEMFGNHFKIINSYVQNMK